MTNTELARAPRLDLTDLFTKAKLYCSIAASPHHITFSVEALRSLIEEYTHAAIAAQDSVAAYQAGYLAGVAKAAAQAVQAVPGWQWVPVEPTLDMAKAAAAILQRLDDIPADEEQYRALGQGMHVYMDMLSAAPQPPAKQVPPNETRLRATWGDCRVWSADDTPPSPANATHTDHPLRHWARDCPACNPSATPQKGNDHE